MPACNSHVFWKVFASLPLQLSFHHNLPWLLFNHMVPFDDPKSLDQNFSNHQCTIHFLATSYCTILSYLCCISFPMKTWKYFKIMQTLNLSMITKLNFQKKTIWHILLETNAFFLKNRCHAFITNKTKSLEGKYQRYSDLNEYTNYKEGIWISSSICREKNPH